MNAIPNAIQSILSVAAILGTYALIIAHDWAHRVEFVMSKGIETEGTVIEIKQNPGSLFSAKEGEGEAPIVDFDSRGGTHHKYFSTTYKTPCPYTVGQKVKIWYYHYKSINKVVLADDDNQMITQKFFRWGIALCIIGYPFVIKKIMVLVSS